MPLLKEGLLLRKMKIPDRLGALGVSAACRRKYWDRDNPVPSIPIRNISRRLKVIMVAAVKNGDGLQKQSWNLALLVI